MNKQNKPRMIGVIVEILGKGGLRDLGFDIPRGKVMAQQAVMLNRVEEELPSASDIAKADDIELSGELRPSSKPSSFGYVKTASISVSLCSE